MSCSPDGLADGQHGPGRPCRRLVQERVEKLARALRFGPCRHGGGKRARCRATAPRTRRSKQVAVACGGLAHHDVRLDPRAKAEGICEQMGAFLAERRLPQGLVVQHGTAMVSRPLRNRALAPAQAHTSAAHDDPNRITDHGDGCHRDRVRQGEDARGLPLRPERSIGVHHSGAEKVPGRAPGTAPARRPARRHGLDGTPRRPSCSHGACRNGNRDTIAAWRNPTRGRLVAVVRRGQIPAKGPTRGGHGEAERSTRVVGSTPAGSAVKAVRPWLKSVNRHWTRRPTSRRWN